MLARLPRAPRLARSFATGAELKPNTSFKAVTHPDTAPATTAALIDSHSQYLLNTYARPPLLFTHGRGLSIFDSASREYLDFTAGIAVTALGHADARLNALAAEQAGKISHASNVYWNEWAGELARLLVESTRTQGGLGLAKAGGAGAKVFFSNSGTEANEGALKFARKYGQERGGGGVGKSTLVCFSNAFHGRSMGALSVTPNPKYQAPFEPLIPNVRVGEYNDLASVDAVVDESVCGVIVEPIQGEGGVGTASQEWLEKLAARCREVGAALIYDEIQCGLFRSGTLWAHSVLPTSAHPDMVTMAKPLANGFPIGAIMVRDAVAEAVSVGSHGTTFGGQPLATRLGVAVLERLTEPAFVAAMQATAAHLDTLVARLPRLFPKLVKDEVRGRGLIRGIAFKDESHPAQVVKLARERGVLLLTAGKDAVRLVPALIVSKEQCDHALGVVESCLAIIDEDAH
ncbi:acetylornithine aminotransferase [Cryptotrichosporon argae]